jgi:hypothetical protein
MLSYLQSSWFRSPMVFALMFCEAILAKMEYSPCTQVSYVGGVVKYFNYSAGLLPSTPQKQQALIYDHIGYFAPSFVLNMLL